MVGVARGQQRADTLKPYSQKTSQSNHTRTTALSNSMKLSPFLSWSNPRWAGHGGESWQNVERAGKGNGKPLQYSCLDNPMNSMKRQNGRILKEVLPKSVGAQMLLEVSEQITPERMMEPKQK